MDRSLLLIGKSGVSEEEIQRRYEKVFPILAVSFLFGIGLLVVGFWYSETYMLILGFLVTFTLLLIFFLYFLTKKV